MRAQILSIVTAAAIVTGGGIAYFTRSAAALAGFGGGTTELSAVAMRRRAGGTVACAGECLVASAQVDDIRPCPLRLAPQASYAACLTALNAACVNTCQTTPSP